MRTIVKEARFERELAAIKSDARRADDFVEAAEWVLSRNPYCEYPVEPEPSVVWTYPLDDYSDGTSANIFYAFSDRYVWFLSIIRVTADT